MAQKFWRQPAGCRGETFPLPWGGDGGQSWIGHRYGAEVEINGSVGLLGPKAHLGLCKRFVFSISECPVTPNVGRKCILWV